MQHAIMETSRPFQCYYCRQRLSRPGNANDGPVVCPGCKLEIKIERSPIFDAGNEGNSQVKGFCQNIRSSLYMNLLRRRTETSPKKSTSLNSKPSPFERSPQPQARKRAVLCGVSYRETKYKLKGTINDVKNMRELLMTTFRYQREAILVLTEDEEEKHHPTKKNIEKALEWLVKDCRKGDSLVFYFSGHGLRQPDFTEDEIDGFDETICPVDFMEKGMILDNDINTTIVKPLLEGVKLHAIVDACHSGTILDLVHVYNPKTRKWEDNSPPSGVNKGTNGGLAICISACEDDKLASDTSAFTGKEMTGVLTFIMIDIVKHHPELTYAELLDKMQEAIDQFNSNNQCLITCKFLQKVFTNRITQRAQLSSSEEFDVFKRVLRL